MFRLATFKAQFVRSPDCASVFSHTSFSDISLPRSRIFLKYVIFRLFFVASVAIDHFQRNGVVFCYYSPNHSRDLKTDSQL